MYEIEYKYNAKNIAVPAFEAAVKELGFDAWDPISSTDHYYSTQDRFMRFRVGRNEAELTSKTKTKDSNNIMRREVNLELGTGISVDQMDQFASMHGLGKDFAIFKTAKIYAKGDTVASYYVVYDSNLIEKDRFIEIEIMAWTTDQKIAAKENLNQLESTLAPLGITPSIVFENLYGKCIQQ